MAFLNLFKYSCAKSFTNESFAIVENKHVKTNLGANLIRDLDEMKSHLNDFKGYVDIKDKFMLIWTHFVAQLSEKEKNSIRIDAIKIMDYPTSVIFNQKKIKEKVKSEVKRKKSKKRNAQIAEISAIMPNVSIGNNLQKQSKTKSKRIRLNINDGVDTNTKETIIIRNKSDKKKKRSSIKLKARIAQTDQNKDILAIKPFRFEPKQGDADSFPNQYLFSKSASIKNCNKLQLETPKEKKSTENNEPIQIKIDVIDSSKHELSLEDENTKIDNNSNNSKTGAVKKLISLFETKLFTNNHFASDTKISPNNLIDSSSINKRKKKLSASKLQTKIKSLKQISAFMNDKTNENLVNAAKINKQNLSLKFDKCQKKLLKQENKPRAKSLSTRELERFGSASTIGSSASSSALSANLDTTNSLIETNLIENDSSFVYSEILLTNLLAHDEHDTDDFPDWTKDEFLTRLATNQMNKSINYTSLFKSSSFNEMELREMFKKVKN